jgi:hypothetical protein
MNTATSEPDLRRSRLFNLGPATDLAAETRARVAALAGDVIRLREGGLWSAARIRTPLRIRCEAGTVWVTQAGRSGDAVLHAGESFATSGTGKVVIQALADAVLSTRHDTER